MQIFDPVLNAVSQLAAWPANEQLLAKLTPGQGCCIIAIAIAVAFKQPLPLSACGLSAYQPKKKRLKPVLRSTALTLWLHFSFRNYEHVHIKVKFVCTPCCERVACHTVICLINVLSNRFRFSVSAMSTPAWVISACQMSISIRSNTQQPTTSACLSALT